MIAFREIMQTTNGWLRELVEFGISLILVFVVIDILFPGTSGIVKNIGEVIDSFAKEGVVGLIALLLFLLIYKK
jgi:hypothetical protein